MNKTIDYFIEEESKGTIFCKIGKSSESVHGKGGYFPYREYIGKVIVLDKMNSITFEPLEEVVKYLHYGDDLVIFSFTKAKDMLPQEGYSINLLNKGCFNAKSIYVDDVLSFKNPDTVDYIYSRTRDLELFRDFCVLAADHLRDRNCFEAAARWEKLANI